MLRFALPERDHGLFSEHYIRDVLPKQQAFADFDASEQIKELEAILAKAKLAKLKEQALEHEFLTGVFKLLGLRTRSQPTIQGKEIDFAFFEGEEFREDFGNTIGICEVKKRGRIERQYTIRRNDNTDPIAQIKFYLKEVNASLQTQDMQRSIEFGVLTDGMIWRLYSRHGTISNDEFAARFFEVRLDEIMQCKDENERRHYLKLFLFLFSHEGWLHRLKEVYEEAQGLAEAVSTGLREQVFTAVELLSTGLWRRIIDPLDAKHFQRLFMDGYRLDISNLHDPSVRRATLRIVYDEAIVFLLRLLFLLYGEDRGLLDKKTFKATGGLLDRIVRSKVPIGLVTAEHKEIAQDFDVQLSERCREIDRKYNGGIFSDEKHPLLRDLNIDNVLFANAIDHLCRVMVGGEAVVVDFGSISVRELGTLYEGLLSYKLTEADHDELAVQSLVDKQKQRFNLQKGDLYLVNQDGERKASGSYYTPDTIVSHLVDQALGPLLDQVLASEDKGQEKLGALLKITVCDPAMGSGHFLVEAFDRISQAVRTLSEEDESVEEVEKQRAMIVRKCLFGVDLNPMAVEIAKMVLWIRTFRPDRPLEFFDANLKCGNSLVGNTVLALHSSKNDALTLFRGVADWEHDVICELGAEVEAVLDMQATTAEEIREKEKRYKERVVALLKDAAFIEHVRLIGIFHPKEWERLEGIYEEILKGISGDRKFLRKMFVEQDRAKLFPDAGEYARASELLQLVIDLRRRLQPVHWPVEFPHVFLQGGFSVVLGNPPWDVIKSNHRTFFSDYITGFADLETAEAKKQGEELCNSNTSVGAAYREYIKTIEQQNEYFNAAYDHQVAKDEHGKKTKKGDNNLYKLFIEQAWRILKTDGRCGFVIPSGLNSDSGCTGLRKLILHETTVDELIMFENRRNLFPAVDSRYKFDALIFSKHKPRKNHRFETGFYWLDPAWLDGIGSPGDRQLHERFLYPTHLTEVLAPDTLSLIEMRSAKDIPILEKLSVFPLLGDTTQEWYIETYSEFHMTSDSDLFNTESSGYPLLEGKCIHQYDATFATPTRWVVSSEGEERLHKRWKCSPEELPNRGYRIAWRDITNATNERTLIATLIPPAVFCGNTLNLIELDSLSIKEQVGLVAMMNALTPDFLLRCRVSTHINAFYIKQLPIPRDRTVLQSLGNLAQPLLVGRDFEKAREGSEEITDPKERDLRKATIDAHVAKLYGLTYEELQHVTRQFPIVAKQNPEYLEEVLRQFRDIS